MKKKINQSIPFEKVLDFIVKAASNEKSVAVINMISENVLELIYVDSIRIQAVATQLCSSMNTIADVSAPKEKTQPTYMQIAAIMTSLVDYAIKLLSVSATYRHIVDTYIKPKKESSETNKRSSLARNTISFSKSVWSENSKALEKEGGGLRAGSLNHIINILTSVDQYDNKFLKTFITTYQSFATPEQVVEKLMERYHFILYLQKKKFLRKFFSILDIVFLLC